MRISGIHTTLCRTLPFSGTTAQLAVLSLDAPRIQENSINYFGIWRIGTFHIDHGLHRRGE
jgi:hypothetical protein